MTNTHDLLNEMTPELPEQINGAVLIFWTDSGGVEVAYNGEQLAPTNILDLLLQGGRVVGRTIAQQSAPYPTPDLSLVGETSDDKTD